MGFGDKVTELIGECSRQQELRRLEKQYEGAEKKLREVKAVTFEGAIREEPYKSSDSAIPHLEPLKRVRSDRTVPPRRPLELERSQSTLSVPICPTPPGPPDITAKDLTSDELRRTYSDDNVWDMKRQPLPPLPKMVGFGAYRRAANASVEWQVEQLQRRNFGMHPELADRLSWLSTGPSEEAILAYRKNSLRSNSFASSKSSWSDISDPEYMVSPLRERIDPKTGTRITRGFMPSPSASSSAASSFKAAQLRKHSSSSTTGTGSDRDQNPAKPPRTSSLIFPAVLEMAAPLSVIPEVKPKKIEKPCAFDDSGDNDMTFLSDDDEEDAWQDVPPSTRSTRARGIPSQRLTQNDGGSPKRAVAEAENVTRLRKPTVDRSKTVKPPVRPYIRRANSRNKKTQVEAKPTAVQALVPRPTEKRVSIHHKKQKAVDEKQSSEESDLCMKETKTSQQTQQVTNPECEDKPSLVVNNSCVNAENMATKNRRSRSGTVIRVCAGNVMAEAQKDG